jgi:hypothetical protein
MALLLAPKKTGLGVDIIIGASPGPILVFYFSEIPCFLIRRGIYLFVIFLKWLQTFLLLPSKAELTTDIIPLRILGNIDILRNILRFSSYVVPWSGLEITAIFPLRIFVAMILSCENSFVT